MPQVAEYLTTALRRDDPTLAPPCCAKLEKYYHQLMTDSSFRFTKNGIFYGANTALARFLEWQINGGEEWQLPQDNFRAIILEKNPTGFLHEVGERNGITFFDNTLWALSLTTNGDYRIRRPVRQSHLPTDSLNISQLFLSFQQKFLEQNV